MAADSQATFIRRALLEPEPPPLADGDALTRGRARLFGGVFNTVLTVASAIIIAALVWPALKFLLIDAVWTGSSRVDCLPETVGREVGACWPFIKAKFVQFMYGFYPASEQWRVDVTYALGDVPVGYDLGRQVMAEPHDRRHPGWRGAPPRPGRLARNLMHLRRQRCA